MRELKKTGDLAVRFIPHRDPVAKREDIIRLTVAAPAQKVATWIRLEDIQFDWRRIEGALRRSYPRSPDKRLIDGPSSRGWAYGWMGGAQACRGVSVIQVPVPRHQTSVLLTIL